MGEVWQFEFFRHALWAGLLVSLVCGVIGTLVVVNRIVFLAGGITHAAYGGIGLSLFMGWPFLIGTLSFSLISAMVMAAVTLRAKHRSDVAVGVLWAVGMAVGVVLIDLTPGYQADLMSYLFGSILAVPATDLVQMAGMTVFILAVIVYYYNDFLALSYDDEFARLRNIPVSFLWCLLLGMIALSVVLSIRVVGLILIIALLTIPPFIAEKFTRSLRAMMLLSSILSALFTVAGLWLSFVLNLSSGATIILVAAAGFLTALLGEKIGQGRGRGRNRSSPNTTAQEKDRV